MLNQTGSQSGGAAARPRGRIAYHSAGIGTDVYGEQDFRADGSYLTTKFVIVIGIPIVPIKTLRVRLVASRTPILGISRQRTDAYFFDVLGEYPLCWSQVLRVYGFALTEGTSIFSAVAFCYSQRLRGLSVSPIILGALAFPPWIQYLVRRRARRRASLRR